METLPQTRLQRFLSGLGLPAEQLLLAANLEELIQQRTALDTYNGINYVRLPQVGFDISDEYGVLQEPGFCLHVSLDDLESYSGIPLHEYNRVEMLSKPIIRYSARKSTLVFFEHYSYSGKGASLHQRFEEYIKTQSREDAVQVR